jgi:hypothetical protein
LIVVNNPQMADGEPTDRPAHQRRVLLRPRIFDQAEKLAKNQEADIAEVVNRAVRELLEREGMWPPKTEEKESV